MAYDLDAQAFIDAVGTLTTAEEVVVDNLVKGFKYNGTWSKHKAIYPMIGGTASAHKFNLKDPRDLDEAFRITFIGNWVHDSNGAKGDGNTAWGNTHLVENVEFASGADVSGSYYSNLEVPSGSGYEMDLATGTQPAMSSAFFALSVKNGGGSTYSSASFNDVRVSDYGTGSVRFAQLTAKDGIATPIVNGIVATANAKPTGTGTMYAKVFALNSSSTGLTTDGGSAWRSARRCGFCHVGVGLTVAELYADYQTVQIQQSELGRQIGDIIYPVNEARPELATLDIYIQPFTLLDDEGTAEVTVVIDTISLNVNSHYPTAFIADVITTTNQIGSGNNNAEETISTGVIDLGSSDIEIGNESGGLQEIGLRFINLNIPVGSTIKESYIQFSADEIDTSAITARIVGQAEDAPVIFDATAFGISSRTKTTAFVDWTIPSWNTIQLRGEDEKTPSLVAIIQEIVDRPTYVATDALVITIWSLTGGTAQRVAESSNGTLAHSAEITVNYIDTPLPIIAFVEIETIGLGWDLLTATVNTGGGAVNVDVNDTSTNLSFVAEVVTVEVIDDAQTFINAVGTLTVPQENAIKDLVTGLKANGTWSKYQAIYPFIGGTATSHKWNLKNPLDTDGAFRGQFTGGMTHSATGILNVNGYMRSFYTPSVNGTDDNNMLGYYSRVNTVASVVEMGVSQGNDQLYTMVIGYSGGVFEYDSYSTSSRAGNVGVERTDGYFVGSRLSSIDSRAYRNGSQIGTTTTNLAGTAPTEPIAVMARANSSGGASFFSWRECAFATIGLGLTPTEVANDYTVIQAYQTALGRAVGTSTNVDVNSPTTNINLVAEVISVSTTGAVNVDVNSPTNINYSAPRVWVRTYDRIIFFSDAGDDTHLNHAQACLAIVNRNPDFVIHGGDTYPTGTPARVLASYADFQSLIDEQKFFHFQGDHDLSAKTVIGDLTLGTTLISKADSWKYHSMELVDLFPTNWKLLGFDDTSWTTANGNFGYGAILNKTIDTIIPSGKINYLFRKIINSSDITDNGIALKFSIDDGCEIYLNGVSIYEFNLIKPLTESSSNSDSISSSAIDTVFKEGYDQVIRIPSSIFQDGDNQLSVLIKNFDATSSDLFFELEMYNYAFPSVGVFGSMPFWSTGFGDGIFSIAPYLPKYQENYTIRNGHTEYFIITTGISNENIFSSNTYGNLGASSITGDWLKNALANSDAKVKILMMHETPVTMTVGKYRTYCNWVLDYDTFPFDACIHGDVHTSQAFTRTNGQRFFDASNYPNTPRTNSGTIQALNPSDWTNDYFNGGAQYPLYIELENTITGVSVKYLDESEVVQYQTEILPLSNVDVDVNDTTTNINLLAEVVTAEAIQNVAVDLTLLGLDGIIESVTVSTEVIVSVDANVSTSTISFGSDVVTVNTGVSVDATPNTLTSIYLAEAVSVSNAGNLDVNTNTTNYNSVVEEVSVSADGTVSLGVVLSNYDALDVSIVSDVDVVLETLISNYVSQIALVDVSTGLSVFAETTNINYEVLEFSIVLINSVDNVADAIIGSFEALSPLVSVDISALANELLLVNEVLDVSVDLQLDVNVSNISLVSSIEDAIIQVDVETELSTILTTLQIRPISVTTNFETIEKYNEIILLSSVIKDNILFHSAIKDEIKFNSKLK